MLAKALGKHIYQTLTIESMRLINSAKNIIKQLWVKPAMLNGYKIPGGKYLPYTRVSNTTSIVSKENLKIGNHVFIGHFNFIESSNGISIGEGCHIANYISILTHSTHHSIRLYGESFIHNRNHRGTERGQVEIGAYSFIGPHTVIAPGTKIGKGSLIAAYSYISGAFPDFSILRGNPAKVIGSTKDIDQLYLRDNPDLNAYYNAWATKKNAL